MSKVSNRPVPETEGSTGWLIPLGSLLLLAAVLRLIALSREPLLNADGIVYILQAKAFCLGHADQFLAAYPYPTNLSLMIAGLFHFTGDWILSGQMISLFFSLLTIIPFYFFNLIFWPRRTAIMVVALYVISPVFVELAGEIIRGPQFWFFLVLGCWGFCSFLEREDPPAYLLSLVATAFILAAWSRIEGLLPLVIAAVWLLFDARVRKIRYLTAYFLPGFLLLIFAGGLLLSHSSVQFNPLQMLTHGVGDRLFDSFERFQWLREALSELGDNPPPGMAAGFFDEVHTLLWLLALGTTGHAIHKTFGNLFFLVAICGFLRIGAVGLEKIRRPRSQLFLLLLILTGLFFIYSQIFLNWSSSERFVALIYFPVLVFSGYGFNRLFFFWQKIRSGSGRISALILFCLLLLSLSCYSILKKSHLSRAVVFKEIGQLLAARHPAGKEMNLCGTSGKIVFTHFYATIDSPGLVSLRKHCDITQVDKLKLSMLQSGQYDYLLLADRDGGRQYFLRLIKEMPDSGITVVIEKNTEKYGKVTLFALRPPGES